MKRKQFFAKSLYSEKYPYKSFINSKIFLYRFNEDWYEHIAEYITASTGISAQGKNSRGDV